MFFPLTSVWKMLPIKFRIIRLVTTRPQVKYTRMIYPYIPGSNGLLTPWNSYKPITIVELMNTSFLLRGGYYNMYMFIFKACKTKVLWLQPQILKKAQLTASPFRSRCLPPSSGRCPYNYRLGKNIDPDTEYSSGFVATQKKANGLPPSDSQPAVA